MEAAKKAVIVFAGTVSDIRTVRFESVGGNRQSVQFKEVRFSATRIWRGEAGSYIILLFGNSDCDYPFEAGQSYIVYADGVDATTGYLGASICSPTKKLELASADIRLLGASRRLAPPLLRPQSPEKRLPVIVLLVAAAVGGAVATTLLSQLLRRFRR
jgi:hypothetical protein